MGLEHISLLMKNNLSLPSPVEKKIRLIGCILIGGKSSRMGQPKHLLKMEGHNWLELIYSRLAGVCDEVVVAGEGRLPEGDWHRLSDAPGCSGPMAGILAAMRHYPESLLIVCACDMPKVSTAALDWLLAQRRDEDWALVPQVDNYCQPLFALYDPRIRSALEDLARKGVMKVGEICDNKHVRMIKPPSHLSTAWLNINRPDELKV